ncbi:MAG: hypothetical protein ABH834_02615 [Candidatus Altiarchaeota archaeon]
MPRRKTTRLVDESINRGAVSERRGAEDLTVPDSIDLAPVTIRDANSTRFWSFIESHGLPWYDGKEGKTPSLRELDVARILESAPADDANRPLTVEDDFLAVPTTIPIMDPNYATALDKAKYISSKLSEGACRLIKGGAQVQLHAGTPLDAIRFLTERGYSRIFVGRTEKGPLDILIAKKDDGQYAFVVPNLYAGSRIHGSNPEDMRVEGTNIGDPLIHYQANLMALLANNNGGENERVIDGESQVLIVDHHREYRETIEAAFRQIEPIEGRDAKTSPLETAIIGGRLLAPHLIDRWRTACMFQEVLDFGRKVSKPGESIHEAMLGMLEEQPAHLSAKLTELLKKPQVKRLFKEAEREDDGCPANRAVMGNWVNALWANYVIEDVRELRSFGGIEGFPRLEVPPSPKQKIANPALPTRNLVYKSSNAESHNLTYMGIPFGNLSIDVYNVLADMGAGDIIFVGTAGSLAGARGGIPAGSVVLPANFIDTKGRFTQPGEGFEDANPALRDFMSRQLTRVGEHLVGSLPGTQQDDARAHLSDFNAWFLASNGVLDLGRESGDPKLKGVKLKITPSNHISLETALQEGPEVVRQLRDDEFEETVDNEASKLRLAALLRGDGPVPPIILFISDEPGKKGKTINALPPEAMEAGKEITVDWLVRRLDIRDFTIPQG